MTTKKTKKANMQPNVVGRLRGRIANKRARNVHKSFQLTKRRDMPKRPTIPGYFKFTVSVFRILFTNKRLFGSLLLLYVVVAMLLIGLTQQDQYQSLTNAFQTLGADIFGEPVDGATKIVSLFGAAVSGGLSLSFSETQQLYIALLSLLAWLVVVWLLRHVTAGEKVRVRDGLYNAGTSFIPTLLIVCLIAVQSLPAVIGITAFSTVTQNAAMNGLEAMLFGVGALLLVVLSLYWVCSSVFALSIVTLPGTYPMTAIRAAGSVAVGRRVSLMLRIVWMAIILVLVWALLLIPILLLDTWVSAAWSPLVAVTVQVLTGFSLIFSAAYIYLLYRRMIDEPAKTV